MFFCSTEKCHLEEYFPRSDRLSRTKDRSRELIQPRLQSRQEFESDYLAAIPRRLYIPVSPTEHLLRSRRWFLFLRSRYRCYFGVPQRCSVGGVVVVDSGFRLRDVELWKKKKKKKKRKKRKKKKTRSCDSRDAPKKSPSSSSRRRFETTTRTR